MNQLSDLTFQHLFICQNKKFVFISKMLSLVFDLTFSQDFNFYIAYFLAKE